MKKEFLGYLLAIGFLAFAFSGCGNTQPHTQKTNTHQNESNLEIEAKKYGLTKEQYYNATQNPYMKNYIDVLGYTEDEYFRYVSNPNYNKKYDDYKKLGLTRAEYFGDDTNNNYGIYYSGDGDQLPLKVDVLVYKSKVNEAIKEINKLNKLISSVKMFDTRFDCRAFIGLPKNVNINDTVCLSVKTYPEQEVDATLALRKLNTVLYAIRPGGEAGGSVAIVPVENFETKGEDYLQKQNKLDNAKITKNQDTSLKSNYVNKK